MWPEMAQLTRKPGKHWYVDLKKKTEIEFLIFFYRVVCEDTIVWKANSIKRKNVKNHPSSHKTKTVFYPPVYMLVLYVPFTKTKCPAQMLSATTPGREQWTLVAGFVTSPSVLSHSVVSFCDPMDCSPPGSSVRGILQASILEWVAISYSRHLLVLGTIL